MYRDMWLAVLAACLMTVGHVSAQAVDTVSAWRDPVAVAAAEVERGWTPRTVRAGDVVVFPFGEREATVTCAPLRACVIELEAGERVLATALGDTERWLLEQVATGAGGRTPLIVLKPTACDLGTNIVISTDRRVYELALDAPRCVGGRVGGDTRYTRHVRFYYPAALVARSNDGDGGSAVRAESLAFTYRWVADRKAGWSPVAVYDDGVHVYVRLPAQARRVDLPVLLLEMPDRSTAVMNYVVTNDTFVTDRVFARAVLVGAGGSPRIEIVNTRFE